MCEFCEDIAFTDANYMQARINGGDFIYNDKNGYGILIDTGYSGCHGCLNNIKFWPMCGRELSHSDHAEWPRMSFYWLSEELHQKELKREYEPIT